MGNPALSIPFTDPVLVFALVMAIILVVPFLASRLRLPGIVGLILAGAVVGPSGLGFLERNDTIVLLGTVGLLFLLFIAGLSLDLNQFNRLRHRSLTFGIITISIPLLLALTFSPAYLGFSIPASILLGGIVGSHTLLAHPIVIRLGITKNEAIIMAVGGSFVADAISLTLLAIVSATTEGSFEPVFWLTFVGTVGLYVWAVMYSFPRLGQWFFRNVRNRTDVEFVFLITLAFLSAFLADVAGLAPIIGAFLAGLALNQLVPEQSTLMSRVSFVGNALFIPFFLVSVGMLVDFNVLVESWSVWIQAIMFTLFVLVGKTAAAKIAQHIYRITPQEGWLIAGLTIPQAAATLAITIIGFQLGLFTQVTVNAVVIMILFTCIIGPWMVERFGREVAIHEEQKPFEPTSVPQRILVPLANPETATVLIDMAIMVRDRTSQQPIYPLTVTMESPDVGAGVASSERLLANAVVHAAAAQIPAIPLIRIDRNVAHGITRAIKEQAISTVIIGWEGERSARALIFGSILDQLLKDSREMVLVSKIEQPLNTVQRMLLFVPPFADHEPGYAAAVRAAKILANQINAPILLLTAPDQTDTILSSLRSTKPEVPVEAHVTKTWTDLLNFLEKQLKGSDLLVSLSVREGSPVWRPMLDRLPRLITQRFPDINLVVLYMSEYRPAAGVAPLIPVEPSFRENLSISITDHLDGYNLHESIIRMVTPTFHENPTLLQNVVSSISNKSRSLVHELRPGILFFHHHRSDIHEPLLFVGINRSGLAIDSVQYPVHVIVILLNPQFVPPEDHLKRIATVARLFRNPEIVDQLSTAGSELEIRTILGVSS